VDQRDRQNLIVAIVVILLIGATYWVMSGMRLQARVEDCLMQRRKNCDQLVR
jgi:hypothetical protein